MSAFKAKHGASGRPAKITLFYAVTFEHPINAPVTVTGMVQASNPARSAYLCVREARSRAKGIRWSSLSVLIDKTGPVGPPHLWSEAEKLAHLTQTALESA